MRLDLEQRLREAAPTFLDANKDVPFFERGFEIGDGWFDLLLSALQRIEQLVTVGNLPVRVSQIKTKFDELRFYAKPNYVEPPPGHAEIFDIIRETERRALHTCRDCGVEKARSHNCSRLSNA